MSLLLFLSLLGSLPVGFLFPHPLSFCLPLLLVLLILKLLLQLLLFIGFMAILGLADLIRALKSKESNSMKTCGGTTAFPPDGPLYALCICGSVR